MFIHNEGGGVHSRDIISRRMAEMMITKKKASIEAFKAFSPENLRREHLFWNRPFPLGVQGIPRRKFMDVDEFAISHERLNKRKGWAPSFRRVRAIGNCTKGEKLTVMMAIEPGDPNVPDHLAGSIEHPRRWIRIRRVAGTTGDDFAAFVDHICSDIEGINHIPGTDDDRVFLWDNLSSHYSPIVYQTVEARDGPTTFNILPRPACQPKCGPIECKICDLINNLKLNTHSEINLDKFEQNTLRACGAIGSFDATFAHCSCSLDGNC